jgi:hypothetical protein
MRITSGGNVGIGTTSPGYLLDVAGAAHASSFPTSSDMRFKTNVTDLFGVLGKLEQIRGVEFAWNEKYRKLGRATPGRQIGVIAQEVERQFPKLVTTFDAGGNVTDARSVDYGRLSAVLLEGVKEQQKQMDKLKAEKDAEINDLKAENEALTQAVCEINPHAAICADM